MCCMSESTNYIISSPTVTLQDGLKVQDPIMGYWFERILVLPLSIYYYLLCTEQPISRRHWIHWGGSTILLSYPFHPDLKVFCDPFYPSLHLPRMDGRLLEGIPHILSISTDLGSWLTHLLEGTRYFLGTMQWKMQGFFLGDKWALVCSSVGNRVNT